jgi:hypothetical protein
MAYTLLAYRAGTCPDQSNPDRKNARAKTFPHSPEFLKSMQVYANCAANGIPWPGFRSGRAFHPTRENPRLHSFEPRRGSV